MNKTDIPYDLSVCITTWNSILTLQKTIDRIVEDCKTYTDFHWEILIYDQASTDGTIDLLKTYESAKLFGGRIIYSETNQGQSISRNALCKAARGAFVLFLDGDIVPIKNSIPMMFEYITDKKLLGLFYDVTGDTDVEAKATPCENPITCEDVVGWEFLMFHYAMYQREWMLAHLLPEFIPFDGPGWGVEEDVAYLRCIGTAFGKIQYRRFYHCSAGRSSNFLNEQLPMSRAKRWGTWAVLKSLSPASIRMVFAQAFQPRLNLHLRHATMSGPSLLYDAARVAMKEFLSVEVAEPDCAEMKQELLFEHDRPMHKLNKKTKKGDIVSVPTRYSPIWLLANYPAVKYDGGGVPWLFHGSVAERCGGLAEFLKRVVAFSAVHTDSPEVMLLCSLLGIPSSFIDEHADKPKANLDLYERLTSYGLETEMEPENVSAFRTLQQKACLSRVILPLTAMLEPYAGKPKTREKVKI